MLVYCLGLVLAAELPVPYAVGAIAQNETGRYAVLESQPTLGLLKEPITVLVGDPSINTAMSECIWGSFSSVLYLGSPPKVCRRGKRIDGQTANGRALIQVSDGLGTTFDVMYPVNDELSELMPIGPFSSCAKTELGHYSCKAEPYTAIEIYGNTSSTWVQSSTFQSQAALFQAWGLFQAILFALLAARGKMYGVCNMNAVMALSADAAAGGAVTQAFLLATGRSVVGLDTEFGIVMATQAELAMTAWCVALAACAYVHAAAFELGSMLPTLSLQSWQLPYKIILRELCEIPLLISLVIVWPETAGPHFLIQLQFMCGLAVSYVAGRGAGLLLYFDSTTHSTLGAAFMLVGGVSSATILCVSTVAASGAITRGGPSVAFTIALQIHAAAGGMFFGTQSRLEQAEKASAGSQKTTIQASI